MRRATTRRALIVIAALAIGVGGTLGLGVLACRICARRAVERGVVALEGLDAADEGANGGSQ
jgi:hypothetical protein